MHSKNQTLSTVNKIVILFFSLVVLTNCSSNDELDRPTASGTDTPTPPDTSPTDTPTPTVNYADIDFTDWKVTLPVDENNNGSPDEYQPSELVNFGYQTLAPVQPFMYDDTEDESLVFYTFPDISTTNSSYSRTELRELINPSNSRENWTLLEGGTMQGRLKVDDISENSNSSDMYHRVIVMQIHGIISQEDMDIHGFSSNNGPPLKLQTILGTILKKTLVM